MRNVKRILWIVLAVAFCGGAAAQAQGSYANLLIDLVSAYEQPADGDQARIDADVQAIGGELAGAIAAHWKRVYLDPGFRLYVDGADDPTALDISGRHAFVVLGYELKDGEMQDELKGRCDAAAAAARAFPESVLVCSGGATGRHNPEGHTEAGLMKRYLSEVCGIDSGRIFIDEDAMTTAENAVNTFRILRAQDIHTMTLVTSTYHQRWAQVLYNALSVLYRQEYGFEVEIVGNYCLDIEPSDERYRQDDRIAAIQLGDILNLPKAEKQALREALAP